MLSKPTLQNDFVRLESLLNDHAESLVKCINEEMWSGMVVPPPTSRESMEIYIASMVSDTSKIPFVVIDQMNGQVVGSTSFYDYVPSQERVELGSTFYHRKVWGSAINPSCKLLLCDYAFTQLKIHRLALRCDSRNKRSIAAIKKLGGVYEGTLREHRIAGDGNRSDTMYFSIMKQEWPAARRKLEKRILLLKS